MSLSGSKAVESARVRRVLRAQQVQIRTEWFIDQVSQHVVVPLRSRVKLATAYLMNRIVINLSKPVVKLTGAGGHVFVDPSSRSKPGEFPRADTTQLLKTIFQDFAEVGGGLEGYVGTPLDYGLRLELMMDRSFLVRSMNEERGNIMKILTGPIS